MNDLFSIKRRSFEEFFKASRRVLKFMVTQEEEGHHTVRGLYTSFKKKRALSAYPSVCLPGLLARFSPRSWKLPSLQWWPSNCEINIWRKAKESRTARTDCSRLCVVQTKLHNTYHIITWESRNVFSNNAVTQKVAIETLSSKVHATLAFYVSQIH